MAKAPEQQEPEAERTPAKALANGDAKDHVDAHTSGHAQANGHTASNPEGDLPGHLYEQAANGLASLHMNGNGLGAKSSSTASSDTLSPALNVQAKEFVPGQWAVPAAPANADTTQPGSGEAYGQMYGQGGYEMGSGYSGEETAYANGGYADYYGSYDYNQGMYPETSGEWTGEYYDQGYENGTQGYETGTQGYENGAAVGPSDYSWYGTEAGEAAAYAAEYYPACQDGYVYDYDIPQADPEALQQQEAVLAVLGQQFPAYSTDALREMYLRNGCDAVATLEEVTQLEIELSAAQRRAVRQPPPPPPPSTASKARGPKQVAPKFDATNFPTLGSGASPAKDLQGTASPKRPPTPTRLDAVPPQGAATPPTEDSSEAATSRSRSEDLTDECAAAAAAPAAADNTAAGAKTAETTFAAAIVTADDGTELTQAPATDNTAAPQLAQGRAGQAETAAVPAVKTAEMPAADANGDSSSSASVATPTKASGDAAMNAGASPFKPSTPTRNAWESRSAAQFVEVLRKTASVNGSAPPPPPLRASSGPSRAAPANDGSGAGKGGRVANGRAAGAKTPVTWVQTGEAVSREYAAARADASDHARRRNAYFQQATQAYLAGNKALAKDLGAKGRAAADAMKRAHLAAAERIYMARNSAAAGGAGDRNGDRRGRRAQQAGPAVVTNAQGGMLMDLHGLHVAEALALLRRQLPKLGVGAGGEAAAGRKLQICVGTGRHTKGARTPARLPQAVQDFLHERSVPFTQPEPGLLEIAV